MQVTPVRWRDLFRRQIYNNQPYFIKPQIFAQKRALCITRSIHLPTVTGYISPFYCFIFQSLQLLRAPLSSGFHCSCHLAAGSPSPFMLLLPPASAPPTSSGDVASPGPPPFLKDSRERQQCVPREGPLTQTPASHSPHRPEPGPPFQHFGQRPQSPSL